MLTAIAIPVFTGQLERARIAADQANVRSWYTEQIAAYLTDETTLPATYDGHNLQAAGAKVDIAGTGDAWTVTYSATNLAADFVLPGA